MKIANRSVTPEPTIGILLTTCFAYMTEMEMDLSCLRLVNITAQCFSNAPMEKYYIIYTEIQRKQFL